MEGMSYVTRYGALMHIICINYIPRSTGGQCSVNYIV